MQIKVNGRYCDVSDGTKISFSKKNNALNFGSLELERTMNFTLAITRKNEEIFQMSQNWHTIGTMARKKSVARLEFDSVNLDGYIYVDKCDATKYNCVFIFGDLIPLKDVSEKGEMINWLTVDRSVTCRLNDFTYAPTSVTSQGLLYAKAGYYNNFLHRYPSIELNLLLASNFCPITFDFTNIPRHLFIVTGTTVESESKTINSAYTQSSNTRTLSVNWNNAIEKVEDFSSYFWSEWLQSYNVYNPRTCGVHEQFFKIRSFDEITLTFPSSFPSDVYLMSHTQTTEDKDVSSWDFKFYGDYSFDTSLKAQGEARPSTGTPLGGRAITLKRVDSTTNKEIHYYFTKKDNFRHTRGAEQSGYAFRGLLNYGWNGGISCPLSVTFDVVSSGISANLGADVQVYLIDNMPKLSFADVLNLYRYIFNVYVTFQNNAIKFTPMGNMAQWTKKKLTNIISTSDVNRKVGDFARKNKVVFDSDEYIGSQALSVIYTIDSDIISANKELCKLKCSEGLSYDGTQYLYCDDDEKVESDGIISYKGKAKKATIAIGGGNSLYRADYYFNKNADLQNICDISTAIKVVCEMSAFEYFQIKENNILQFDGCLWLWTSANWNDGKATFELQKYQ